MGNSMSSRVNRKFLEEIVFEREKYTENNKEIVLYEF
jgi:hypothetical protein